MSSTTAMEQFSHVELEFQRLEFHSNKFEDGKGEKEKKRRKIRFGSKEEEEDLEKTGSEEDERLLMTTKNALAGSSMMTVASKRHVVEMSVGEPW